MCKINQINPFQVKAEYLLHGGLAKKGQEYLKMPISLKVAKKGQEYFVGGGGGGGQSSGI